VNELAVNELELMRLKRAQPRPVFIGEEIAMG
jgi:hypothetical protein